MARRDKRAGCSLRLQLRSVGGAAAGVQRWAVWMKIISFTL